MKCPSCRGKTTVVCCRRDSDSVQRRRKCLECGRIFFTEERETENGGYFFQLDYEYNRHYYKKRQAKKT